MENNQRISQIMQALQMREEGEFQPNGMRTSTPTVTGEAREVLVAELVKLLTITPEAVK
jgi:hypothetical protein